MHVRSWASAVAGAVLLAVAAGSSPAHAGLTINSVTVDGGATTTVAAGDMISVRVTVSTTGSSSPTYNTDWKCTAYQIEGGSLTNVNTANHTTNGFTNEFEDFNITAPSAAGTYDLVIRVYNNDPAGSCSGEEASTTLTDAIVVLASPPDVTKSLLDGPNDSAGDPCSTVVTGSLGWECSNAADDLVHTGADAGGIWLRLTESQHYVYEIEIANETGGAASWVVTDSVGADFDMDADAEDRANGPVDNSCGDGTCDGIVVSGSACSAHLSQPPSGDGVGGSKEPEFIDISVDDLADEASCTITVYVMTVENPGAGNDYYEPAGCRVAVQDVTIDDVVESYTLNSGLDVYDPTATPPERILGPVGSLKLTCNDPDAL